MEVERKGRGERLDGERFPTLDGAAVLVESGRRRYTAIRQDSSLGARAPAPEAIVPPARGLPYATLRSAHGLADRGRTLT